MTDLSTISDDELLASLPRGVRTNNPLNLKDTSGQFRTFPSMDEGIAAADQNLQAYKTRHGINTINGVVSRWAPPSDGNDPAAYAAHVSKATGIAPDARIDLADANTRRALLTAMGEHENGAPVIPAAKPDLSSVSDAELLASLGRAPAAAPAKAAPGLPAPIAQMPVRKDQVLGVEKGFMKPWDNGASGMEFLARKVGIDKPINALGHMLGLPGVQEANANHAEYIAQQKAKGVLPGKIGEFGGNTLSTVLATMGMGPVTGGALSGALLTDKKDLGGVAADAALGAVTGRATAALSDAAQIGVRKLLSKAPSIMDLPALQGAVKAAYGKVDASGFTIPVSDMKGLASAVSTDLRAAGGPKAAKLYPDADAFAARLSALADQKGGVSVSQLDTLRSDIYDAMIKPGGKEAGVGKAMRAQIDGLIDSIPNGDVKAARALYTRLAKVREIAARTESADLRASSTYAGGNQANATRQNLRPLIDPKSPQRIRNLTPDETSALNTVVRGTPAQNAMRVTGKVLDPRGLIGASAQALNLPTHGLYSLSIPVGMGASAASNSMTNKSVRDLIDLVAAGGSKQALARIPTAASHAAEQAVAAIRPYLVAASVPALAAARRAPQDQPKR